jgi:hypothetical protein
MRGARSPRGPPAVARAATGDSWLPMLELGSVSTAAYPTAMGEGAGSLLYAQLRDIMVDSSVNM